MHTEETLRNTVLERLNGGSFVVVSNREPFIHRRLDGRVVCMQPASGVTRALDPVLRAARGLWVAHGSGDADREVVDFRDCIAVPPERPRYTLKRVWLSQEQEERYYYGFANQALWPLCHVVYQRPVFEEVHWRAYQEVNARFADAIAEEIAGQRAFVFIQDYHLALLSRMIKERCPDVITAQFWHIPWPNPEVFRICPWQQQILEGLLGNDVLGFHLRYHCMNFVDTVARVLEARVDSERLAVIYGGVATRVRSFPISVDFEAIQEAAETPEVCAEMGRLRQRFQLRGQSVAVGLDRLDYTKGIPERFRAIDRFLMKYPEYRGRFTFLQVGVPTRSRIPQYQQAEEEMGQLAAEINRKYQREDWQPIVFAKEHFGPVSVHALYRLADMCIVSSLHDGMNLVAKEFVATRSDEAGVLLLSPFTGASRELREALLVNPYATDEFAEAIRVGLEMDPMERRLRMRRLRQTVARDNIYCWASRIVEKLSDLSEELGQAEPLGALTADIARA